jgi:hypothetical protein
MKDDAVMRFVRCSPLALAPIALIALIALIGLIAPAAAACGPPQESAPPAKAGGRLWIVDTDAEQEGVPGFPGAILEYDLGTHDCRVVAADPRFVDPQDVAPLADGGFLVLDSAARLAGHEDARGGLFRFAADGRVLRTYSHEALRAPTAMLAGSDDVVIADRGVRGEGGAALYAIDLASGEFTSLLAGESATKLVAPSALLRDRDGSLLVLDADVKEAPGPGPEGAVFRLTADRRAIASTLWLEGTISPLGMLALDGGDLLIFDTNADPKRLGGPAGALFALRRGGDVATTELLVASPRFRDPVRGELGPDGRVWFVDANADPERRGEDRAGRGQNLTGPGAIIAFDPKSGELEFVASPALFVNPVALHFVR